jgi:hypothetical protein
MIFMPFKVSAFVEFQPPTTKSWSSPYTREEKFESYIKSRFSLS